MIKLKPLNLTKVFIDVSRKVVRELSAMVKNSVEVTGDRYPALSSTQMTGKLKSQLKKLKKKGRIKDITRSTRMYNRGYFSRNAFEFKVERDKNNNVSTRLFLSKKDHYSGHSYADIGRWNMGENEEIRKSMGRYMFLFPQNTDHADNLNEWKKGTETILKEAENQIVKNLEIKIQKTIKI